MKYFLIVLCFLTACAPKQPAVSLDPSKDSFMIKSETEMTYDEKIKFQQEVINRQEQELKAQAGEIAELKRQKIYYEATKDYNSKVDKK